MLDPFRQFYLSVPWHVINIFWQLSFVEADDLFSSEEVKMIERMEVKEEVCRVWVLTCDISHTPCNKDSLQSHVLLTKSVNLLTQTQAFLPHYKQDINYGYEQ